MKEALLNILKICGNWWMHKFDLFLHWLYKFTYGTPCNTFEQELNLFMMMMGWLIIVLEFYYVIKIIIDGRKYWLKWYSEHEFYLFQDEVIHHRNMDIIKCAAAIISIVAFASFIAVLLMVIALPTELRDDIYSFWRWIHGFFY